MGLLALANFFYVRTKSCDCKGFGQTSRDGFRLKNMFVIGLFCYLYLY